MKRHYIKYYLFCILILYPCVFNSSAFAALGESLAISAKALSLGNSVTAYPQGGMSAHYNPAGFSRMDDGKTMKRNLFFVQLAQKGTFNADPDWEGLHRTWGPGTLYNPDDPLRDHGGPDPLDGTEGKNSQVQIFVPIPAIGALPLPIIYSSTFEFTARKKDSPWTFAYNFYGVAGGGIIHGDDYDPYRFNLKSAYAQHLVYAGPGASYAFSDTFSVGFTIPIAQSALGAEFYARAPNMMIALTRIIGDATRNLEIPVVSETTYPPPWYGGGMGPYETSMKVEMELRDDFVPSFNLGLLWSPKTWLSFGFNYQSKSVAELTGDYKFSYSEQYQKMVDWSGSTPMTLQSAGMLDNPYIGVPHQSGTATTKRTIPQFVNIGTMVQPIPKLKVMYDLHWANYSVNKQTAIYFDQRIQPLRSAKMLGYQYAPNSMISDADMKDTWHWSTGLEYQVKDSLKVRCGMEKRPTSIETDLLGTRSLAAGAILYGAGVEITKPDGKIIDLSLGWLKGDHLDMPNNSSTQLNSTDFTELGNSYTGLDIEQKTNIYIISIGIKKPFGNTKATSKKKPSKLKPIINKIKGLFRRKDKKQEPVIEEDDFDEYLDNLSAAYDDE